MSDHRFTMFGLEQAGHCFFDLIEQFVNDAVKLDLYALPSRRGNGHILDLHIKADDNCVRCARQQNVRLRNGPDR